MADAFQLQSTVSVTKTERHTLKILTPNKNDFPSIINFVSPYESSCVQLCSYIRKNSSNIRVLSKIDEILPDSILGILYFDRTIFHCIPEKNLPLIDQQLLLSALCNSIKRIKCVTGNSSSTDFLISLIKQKFSNPYQVNHYNLMTASSISNPPEPLYNDDQVIHCTENDLEALLPLQKQYLQEEVAPPGREISDLESQIGLRQILKNQLCVALSSDGEIVAKANTNAIGINWIQLGGVYTHPLFRRNGYAWHLISAICRRTTYAGKSTALFVKDINVPAIELYKKLGFSKTGTYTIAYFE